MTSDMSTCRPRRSFIFVAGSTPRRFESALGCGADIVCVDLEDGVAPGEKESARVAAFTHFNRCIGPTAVERAVRINSLHSSEGIMDLQALLANPGGAPAALMLPKVKGPEEVRIFSALLDECGISSRLFVIIETNEGLENVGAIARASSRIEALFFGGFDMAADLRCLATWPALSYARSRLIHAAASAGIDAIDVPFLDLHDVDGLHKETELAAEMGFSGKGAIHPTQVQIINQVFTPDAAVLNYAISVLDAFKHNGGGLLVYEGKLIEEPVIRNLARVVALADAVQASDLDRELAEAQVR